ncbi:MAG: hypothetical protein KKD48_03355 [Nanoarchaeota archaeon]|nr:hypothetical protein [Nanoarchaeota archaeon]
MESDRELLESNLVKALAEVLPKVNKQRTLCDRLLGIKYECDDPDRNNEHEIWISEEEPNLKTELKFFATLFLFGDGYRGSQIYTQIKIKDGRLEYNIAERRKSLKPIKYLLSKFAIENKLEIFYKEKV